MRGGDGVSGRGRGGRGAGISPERSEVAVGELNAGCGAGMGSAPGGADGQRAVRGRIAACGTKGLVPHAAMRSPASAQAALTYTVKLIQEGPFGVRSTMK